MTPEFETTVRKAIENDVLPGAVMLVRSKDGKLNYSHASGPLSLSPSSAAAAPLKEDSILAMASTTKLLTAIAVLQLVQEGKISLEDDISPLLPELAAQPVLSGFTPSGQAILSPRTEPLLLRYLLTHSAGCSYTWNNPDVVTYLTTVNNRTVPVPFTPVGGTTVPERCSYPLTSQPGKGWVYGTGLDWAGHLVEKISGVKLDEYFQDRILSPVGVKRGEITFYPGRYDGVRARQAGMTTRGKGRLSHHRLGEDPAENEAMGGEAGFGSMAAYITVLADFLEPERSKLLREEYQEVLFGGCLTEESKKVLNDGLKGEGRDWMVGWVNPVEGGARYDWSPAGLVTVEPGSEGGNSSRRKGFVQWGGAFNLAWFIDREAGVCGVFATQIVQPGDLQVRPLIREFEETIYSKL
ncbi:beta-lactamase/transpeptidase-like protein [Cercophora samala]|uniref:Beta-lactamase/transpeptidase-like protein n=1 Tax=Cercophora samala TaxID=330535 RepID=A0AA40D944_9PEZI|nr:beta-lactamase/transpeptidase-like protein [Cercophora samala]